MSSHTPGPWSAVDERGWKVRYAQTIAVADVYYPRDETPNRRELEAAANARLIAAAPDLLAALKDLVDCHARFTGEPGHDCNVWAEADDRARAAISSASEPRP